MINIRPAKIEEAQAIAELSISSIRELCGPHYENDEELLKLWTGNKTKENLERWIADEQNYLIVAEQSGARTNKLVGVASLRGQTVQLCYLQPGFEGRGIGAKLMESLFDYARTSGLSYLDLSSTRNAKSFYERCGFVLKKEQKEHRIPSWDMEKFL